MESDLLQQPYRQQKQLFQDQHQERERRIMKNYKIIEGSEVRGSDLRLPRAISIYRAALVHKQASKQSN